jgi:hypothetical protein
MASQVADASAEVSWEGRNQVNRLGAFPFGVPSSLDVVQARALDG